jgi:hypothetical protein
MIPRILEALDQARQQFTWRELCYELLPCATVLRWRARSQAGQPLVEKAGPKKRPAVNFHVIQYAIEKLDHGRTRTVGTTELCAQFADSISRRDLQEWIAQERDSQNKSMKRIQWLVPGAAWSLDTTEYGPDRAKITPLRDLASKYQVPTPLVAPAEDGQRIAIYLDLMFKQHGAPMFLKRDGGSPLNCAEVDQVLEAHRVLPLNSPPRYPQYNGSIERSMRDLHNALDQRRLASLQNPLALDVELVTHQLNHRRLRSLRGQTPCQVFHDPARRLHLHGASRQKIFREVFNLFWHYQQRMTETNPHTIKALWRAVVESWLRRQGWISVSVSTQSKTNVSTNSGPFFSQN